MRKAARVRALGVIAPHAGYVYSGAVAGAVYAQIEVPRKVIVLCPNHTGMGEPLAIMSEGRFRTPLGDVEIDGALAEALKRGFPLLREDESAQLREHAVEVQLPFLQVLRKDVAIVPITVGIGQFEVLSALGVVMAKVIAECGEPVLMVASSDMNHYEADDGDPGEGCAGDCAGVRAASQGTLRDGAGTGDFDVRLWPGSGDADGGAAPGRDVCRTAEVCDLGGRLRRPGARGGVCGDRGELEESFKVSEFQGFKVKNNGKGKSKFNGKTIWDELG